MTLQQLSYFVAVADVRSFTRAADSVGVAQPTLSRQLRALEADLGSPLIDRGGRDGPVLTPAGEAVLPLARRMLADMETARVAVADIVGLRRGRVRVGATPSLCIGVLADVLRVFHSTYPDIQLELVESGSQPLVRSLVRGEIDVAMVIVPPAGVDQALHTTPLLRERLSVASPASGRSPGSRGSMGMQELARRPLVVPREGYDVRETTLQAFADAGATPRFAVQGGEMDAVLRMVEAGTGVAVVPDLVFAGRPRLRRTVLTPALYRTVALARRADLVPTQAVKAFRDTLLTFLSDLSAAGGFPGDVQVLRRPDPA
ncbi:MULTISPECIES: LysR substrate-binding domain-containing protein [unclassified Pseudonocardia]|jgi:DNA-binding transcriptional LysR family regulator|uniref:LysR family transcriptional regulator n=1 Tax=unclassified Pseudonocardia TaxID=2619320 RepID=UPI0009688196|nr:MULTISPECIES: LysR substrate-binding domain-containing protein [unclassified Pseudonocardia]MBN9099454.1 LysR family transcriptional regulator [Pseudonocardia sp.]OJY48635.1 MAG: LysR family transcriptional regulator [Pseudonocardia sp. 73-21]